MTFTTLKLSDKGLKREENEDSILINKEKNLFLVADGMGGHKNGKEASQLVVDTFNNYISTNRILNITNKEHLPEIIQECVNLSSDEIKSYARKNSIKSTIGSTLVGIYKNKQINELSIFHIGDSRAYRIRNNQLEQLTIDHTVYEEKKRDNSISKEALEKINKNKLSRAIGNFPIFKIETKFENLEDEDIFILCSDGVYNYIEGNELLEFVKKSNEHISIENIKSKIYKNGAKDNLSLIIIRYNK